MRKDHVAIRCPHCNRIGSPKIGGYCKRCHEKLEKENQNYSLTRKHYKTSFGEGFRDKEWHPKSFGIIKDSFGVCEK